MNKKIDFYVDVIDNFWDLGFAINLIFIMLKNDSKLEIRLFSNDEKLYKNMVQNNIFIKNIVYFDLKEIYKFEPNNLIFNFFDRKIDFEFLKNKNYEIKLINFSYLLMHKWVENLHLTSYRDKNIEITHFVPSLLKNTWWVLINKQVQKYNKKDLILFLEKKYNLNLKLNLENKFISIFVYSDTLNEILSSFTDDRTTYFIFWYTNTYIKNKNSIIMPFMELEDYNNFLSICDVNYVRGENSLISSLIYWKPTIWDIYKENNNAHIEKIEDFIDFLRLFSSFNESYFELFRNFNKTWQKEMIFNEFSNNYFFYKDMFFELWKYLNNECDAYEKIKKILN